MIHIKKIDACKQFCVHEKVLNNAVVSDNRKFWQTISPLFSEKAFRKATLILKDNNRTITNNHELAETFNTFFINITRNLKIDSNLLEITQNLNTSDPVSKTIKSMKNTQVSSK